MAKRPGRQRVTLTEERVQLADAAQLSGFILYGRSKWLVASSFAVCAFGVVTSPANAPLLEYRDPAYASSHQLAPIPVMGIRGDARVLIVAPAV